MKRLLVLLLRCVAVLMALAVMGALAARFTPLWEHVRPSWRTHAEPWLEARFERDVIAPFLTASETPAPAAEDGAPSSAADAAPLPGAPPSADAAPPGVVPAPPAPPPGPPPALGRVVLHFKIAGSRPLRALEARSVRVLRSWRLAPAPGEVAAEPVEQEFRASCDGQGRLSLDLDPGFYSLRFEADGFFTHPETGQPAPEFPVAAGDVLDRDVHLVIRLTVNGRVTSALDGRPLVGYEVELEPRTAQPGPARGARADGEGRYRFEDVAGHQPYRLLFRQAGFALHREDVPFQAGSQFTFDRALQPVQRVLGQVQGEDGVPAVARAQCYLIPLASLSAQRKVSEDLLAKESPVASDPTGRFAFADVPAGRYVLVVVHRDYLAFQDQGLAVRDQDAIVNVMLRPGARLTGIVKDAAGAPLSGVEVRLAPEAPDPHLLLLAASKTVVTGDDGVFRLSGLFPGRRTYRLRLAREGYGTRELTGLPPNQHVPVTLVKNGALAGVVRVAPGETAPPLFTVRLRDGDHRQVGNAFAGRYAGPRGPASEGLELGAFRFAELPPGRYVAELTADGFADLRTAPITLDEGEERADLRLELSRGGLIAGRVLEAKSGLAISGAVVWLDPLERPGEAPAPEGRRALHFGRFEFPLVSFGRHRLLVEHPGYAPARLAGLEVTPAVPECEVTVLLVEGARVAGVVQGPHAAPLTGVALELHDQGGIVATRATDGDGRFAFFHVAPGEYTLVPNARRSTGTHPYLERLPARRLALTDGAAAWVELGAAWNDRTLAGRVLPAEPGTTVELFGSDGVRLRTWTARTDAAGAFAFPRLSVGWYALRAGARERLVEVTEADDAPVVELAAGTGAIEGRLFDAESGRPVVGQVRWTRAVPPAHWLEEALDALRPPAATDADGRFRVSGLAPDEYRLTARAEAHGPADRIVTVDAGTVALGGIDLGPEAGRRVRITDAQTGRPIAGARVFALRPGRAPHREPAPSDVRGAAVLRGGPPGPCDLLIHAAGYRTATAPGAVLTTEAAPALDVALTPRGAERFVVLIRTRDGAPVAGAWVDVRDGHGHRVRPPWTAESLRAGTADLLLADAEGRVTLAGLADDTYLVTALAPGRQSLPVRARFAADAPTLTITLDE